MATNDDWLTGTTEVTLDPELPIPAEENRPGTPTLAHSIPRRWAGTHQQIIRFLDQEDPGVLAHAVAEALADCLQVGHGASGIRDASLRWWAVLLLGHRGGQSSGDIGRRLSADR